MGIKAGVGEMRVKLVDWTTIPRFSTCLVNTAKLQVKCVGFREKHVGFRVTSMAEMLIMRRWCQLRDCIYLAANVKCRLTIDTLRCAANILKLVKDCRLHVRQCIHSITD